MVLVKVGEKVVDVLVNGTQEGSFTQDTGSADYDVSVSANTNAPSSISDSFSLSEKLWADTGNTSSNVIYSNGDWDTVSLSGTFGNHNWEIYVEGSRVASGSDGASFSTGNINYTGGDIKVTFNHDFSGMRGAGMSFTVNASRSIDNSTTLTVNGVTQS